MSDRVGRQILEICHDVLEDGDESLEVMMEGRRLILQYDWREQKMLWSIASIPPTPEDGAGALHGAIGPQILGILHRALGKPPETG